MKKVMEVSSLTGVTRRTLQYYDDEGLVSAQRSKDNYRLYDDEAVERLWQILFYREMGFSLGEIKSVMNSSEKEWMQWMELRIGALTDEQDKLDKQICFAKAVRKYGIPPICCTDDDSHMTYVECISILREILADIIAGKRNFMQEEITINLSDEFIKWIDEKCGKGI